MYTVFLSVHEKVLGFSFSKFALFVTWARLKRDTSLSSVAINVIFLDFSILS